MNPLTREWVAKSEGDFVSAQRELRARKAPNYDSACFHAQQCAEKLLKALLQEENMPFGKTHNLIALLELLLPRRPGLELLRSHLEYLTAFSVQFRYPGESADRAIAGDALIHCKEVRRYFAEAFGLELA
jgi:HEPN domain-containing protein